MYGCRELPGGITGQVVSNYTASPEGAESAPVAPVKQDNTLLLVGEVLPWW